jgi:hypothetical protein
VLLNLVFVLSLDADGSMTLLVDKHMFVVAILIIAMAVCKTKDQQ